MDIVERVEEALHFKQKGNDSSAIMFQSGGSAGANPVKLARILIAYSLAMNALDWSKEPVANLITFLTQYQASVDTHYHKDYKDVLIAEEIERRREERKGVSILNQGK